MAPTHADEIRSYAAERVELVAGGLWSGVPLDRREVLEVAEGCLEAHQRQSVPLYEEMEAMAESAGISLGGWCKTVGATARLPLTRHYVIGRRSVKGFRTTLLDGWFGCCHADRAWAITEIPSD